MTQTDSIVPSSTSGGQREADGSGVHWAAVIAGAFATAALSLILLSLGAGLGLSRVSPWSNAGASASAIGSSAIIWLIVMEILSAAMGGYLAGRLRTKWTTVHSDEVYFRDTAHGFLAWATALVITAAFLATAATSMIGASVSSKSETSGQAAGQSTSSSAYFVDSLFRGDGTKADVASTEVRTEVGLIFAKGLTSGALSSSDKAYLDQLVVARTGLPGAAADERVVGTFTQAQQAADTARKAVAHSLLWIFVALLFGAFSASFAATIGGRQRDHVVVI